MVPDGTDITATNCTINKESDYAFIYCPYDFKSQKDIIRVTLTAFGTHIVLTRVEDDENNFIGQRMLYGTWHPPFKIFW